jgi:hypothetical protein
MPCEEADDALLLAGRNEVSLEAGLQCDREMVVVRGSSNIGPSCCLRCRSCLRHDDERAQASE